MSDTLKVLAQSNPSATTLTDLYTVPSVTSVVGSTIFVCNTGSSSTTFRISVAVAGVADTLKQYLYYDITIPGNDTFAATVGISLATTDKVRIFAGNGNLTFNLFGTEIT